MVTRFSVAAPEQSAMHVDHEPNRVYGNTVRFQHDPAKPGRAGTVMSTRQRVGTADTVQLQPGIEGTRTHIGTAVRMGLLVETSPGYYADAPAAPAAQPTTNI